MPGDSACIEELARTLAGSVTKLAEGDPLPIFLKSFYNNEVGKEAPEARAGSLAPLDRLDQAEIINYGCLNQHEIILNRNGRLSNGGGGRSGTKNGVMVLEVFEC